MGTASALELGRQAYGRRAWRDAVDQLSAADRETTLRAEDLELLGTAAYLVGLEPASDDALQRAYGDFLTRPARRRAARVAFWLGMGLIDRGETARGGGWLARAQRLLDGHAECAEQGYLLIPDGLRQLFGGEAGDAYDTFSAATRIGDRQRDQDLTTLGRLGQGQATVSMGELEAGLRLLDEAMVAVTADEVSPRPAGIVYCAVIQACHDAFDLGRAQEWTAALGRWCEAQPELVPYRGQCLVHRAQIMQWRGAWADAFAEALRAREWLSSRPGPAVGAAAYQQAEIHRLRGEYEKAEEAYRDAGGHGHQVNPGLALLQLARGNGTAAATAIRRGLDGAADPRGRSAMLPGYVEVMLATGDVAAARTAADDLAGLAAGHPLPLMRAIAAHARGAVLLAEGHPRAALDALGAARTGWLDLDAPYEAAQARILAGLAYRALGDEDAARLELVAARQVFERLGAAPDADRATGLLRPVGTAPPGGLTGREVQVLRLVAAGLTNRAIGRELVVSEKTVARHLSNIFGKLGISSRSAATAYAYRHDLV